MKTLCYVSVVMILLTFGAIGADAEVNEILTFTSFTGEELYVELSVFDDHGWYIYDLYVLPDGTSIANFWVDTVHAIYSACAYGEITGDFYGCIDGGIGEYWDGENQFK
jgi:hypothetical protein